MSAKSCLGLLLLTVHLCGCGQSAGHGPGASESFPSKAEAVPSSAVTGVSVSLNAGWNSVGLQAEQLTALSADPAILGASRWTSGGYTLSNFTQTDLNTGAGGRQGLWVFANSATSFTYSGTGGPSFVDLTLNGYNLVSFCTSSDLPGSRLTATQNGQSVPLGSVVLPQFTEIGPNNQYSQVDVSAGGVIKPGRAYWVAANTSNGPVRLNVTAPSPSPAASPGPSPTPSVAGPTLSSVSPSSGWIGGTSGIVLTGSGFRGATEVLFGGVSVRFTVVSDTEILADSPPQSMLGSPAQAITVQVVTPGGTSPAAPGATYTYTTAAPPGSTPPPAAGDSGPFLYIGERTGNQVSRKSLATAPGPATVYSTGTTAPQGLAFAPDGRLFVTSSTAGTVDVIPPGGGTSTVYGTGLTNPQGLAFEGTNLFVGNTSNIAQVASPGGAATFAYNLALGITPGFNPGQLALNAEGFLMCADEGIGIDIRRGGPFLDTFFGLGITKGLAFDSSGNVYASLLSGTIVRIAYIPGGSAGTFSFYFTGLNQPQNLAFDAANNLYVAEYGAGTGTQIRKILPPAVPGDAGIDGGAFVTGLNGPWALTIR